MSAKIITVTGISGSGSRSFCSSYDSKKAKIYHTGDMIFELAQDARKSRVPKENLLNLHPEILSGLRDRVFDTILANLSRDKKEYERIFIDTHAQFFWNNVYENAYNWKYLNQIPTDLFVTIINKPSSIKSSQMATEHGRVQDHDYRDLLLWQNVEVNVTKGWASNNDKPMYVFSGKQHPIIIDSLLDNRFLVYASFPMTDASPEATEKINRFKKRLRDLRKPIDGLETPILDPADIDVETGDSLSQRVKEAIDCQTVHRDLNWDIEQATHVVSVDPDDKTTLSKGVSDEDTRAMETGKFVYLVYPKERRSPFIYIAHKVFNENEPFFKFFGEHMKWALEYFKRK